MEHSQTQVIYEANEFPDKKSVHRKLYKTPIAEYSVLTYDKKSLATNDDENGKYRSVIFSQGKLVSFSPPKSVPVSDPFCNIPETVHVTETDPGMPSVSRG